MNWVLIRQAVLAVLLVLTIGYCAVLERRLRIVRAAQDELQGLLAAFGKATEQAERGIGRLRETANDVSAGLQDEIEGAAKLRDELRLMVQSGNMLADKIERGLTRRGPMPRQEPEREREPEREVMDDEAVSESERELIKALRQVS